MIIKLILTTLCVAASFSIMAQVSPETLAKRQRHKNLTVKESNTDSKGKSMWVDHLTVYDDEGRKVEEIEYSTYGQRERITIKYNQEGKVEQEVVYNERNRVVRIRKYEYNPDGTKKKQYNYLPSGKLYSVKTFEYIFSDK